MTEYGYLNMTGHLLSLAIWLPIVAGFVVLATGNDRNANLARWLALAGGVASFLVTLPLYFGFQSLHGGPQFEEMRPWIASFNINYHLGIDGLSMWFILLNSFVTLTVIVAGCQVITE